ncbi:MAG: hypothetical protein AB3N16_10605 [Flavobacteriaceae bacterium]
MKKILASSAFALLTSQMVFGQIKIGDNPQNIDTSAVLELESTDKVLIITRVTNAQMNAIVPSRGAMVYNVDEQCVFYYDGTQWGNLCEGSGSTNISFSTDPIVNDTDGNETIVITQDGTNYNFEVAPNSINSAQIIDGGVNGVDIQNNSIGQNKLANDAVEREKLATNAVGLDALDTNEVTLNTLTNDAGFITSTDIISPDANNAITYSNGAFYDDSQIKEDILANTDVIEAHLINDQDTSGTNELQDLSLNGTVLEIEQGNNVDLGPIISAGGSDDQNLILTGDVLSIESGTGSVDLNNYVDDADASTTNELITRAELVGTNLIIEEGSGNDYSVPLGGLGGGGTTEEVDDVTLTGAGTAVDPFKIKDGGIGLAHLSAMGANTNGQILKWDQDNTTWTIGTDISGGTGFTDTNADDDGLAYDATAGYDVNVDDTTIEIDTDQLQLKDGGIGLAHLGAMGANTNGQILKWDQDNTTWTIGTDISGGAGFTDTNADDDGLAYDATAGYDVNVDDATIEIDTDQLQLKDEGIGLAPLSDMGAPTDGQILKWDNTAGEWTVADDDTGAPSLNDGNIFVGDATNTPQGVTMSGDATMNNTGVLDLADNAVELSEIDQNGATDGQIMRWDATANSGSGDWIVDDPEVHTGTAKAIFFADADGTPTTTDDNTNPNDDGALIWDTAARPLGINTYGALYVGLQDGSPKGNNSKMVIIERISNAHQQMGLAFPLQIQNENGTNTGDAATGILFAVDAGGSHGKGALVFERKGAWGVGDFHFIQNDVGDSTLPDIDDKSFTVTKDKDIQLYGGLFDSDATPDLGTNGQVLSSTGSQVQWVDPSSISGATSGAVFFGAADGTLGENSTQFFWNNTNNRLGVGTSSPSHKLHVMGHVRSEGYANSDGISNEPSYAFTNDTDTGMWRGNTANHLRFSTEGLEVMTIDDSQNVGIGNTTPNSKLQVAGSFSLPITTTSADMKLNNSHYYIILGGAHDITLPAANTCTGRIYIIKNPTAFNPIISTYKNEMGADTSTIPNGIVQLQSDGSNWQQIN